MIFPDVGNTILLETNVPCVHRLAFITSRPSSSSFKFFIALRFTTYQHYTINNINNNIHIYRVMYMMMVESD